MVSQSVRERLERRLEQLDHAARLVPRFTTQEGLLLRERAQLVERLEEAA
jgi:hypothetical protein